MKKQIVFKIVVSVCCFLSLIGLFWLLSEYIDTLKSLKRVASWSFIWKEEFEQFIAPILAVVFSIILNIFFLIYINLKDVKILTASLIEKVKEYRASTAEKRKADKQAKLTQEIAEKQAELEELSKHQSE